MRVLMFGWEFPPHRAGGLATATHGLVKGLLQQRLAVTLVVPFPVGPSPLPGLRMVSATELRRLRRIRIPSLALPYESAEQYFAAYREAVAGTRGAAIYGRNLFEEVERLAAVAGEIAAAEPHDVIDTHDWITFRAGIRAREVSGRPLVAHIHATEFDRSGEGVHPVIAEREWEGLDAADLVISNSHALKRQIVARYNIPADKVEVVHWGIDDDYAPWTGAAPSPFPPNVPVVLFLGRITRQKGPGQFLDAARRVADFVPQARFVMAGTGDLLPHAVERAVELDLADRVYFAGPIGGPDVDRAFRLATVCVMPSVSEPFGLVALESLRSGTPCVVSREAGAAEVLSNVCKVDFWDVDEMTNKIVAIINHAALRDELSERGREEVAQRRFSLAEPARLTKLVYQRAAAHYRNHDDAGSVHLSAGSSTIPLAAVSSL